MGSGGFSLVGVFDTFSNSTAPLVLAVAYVCRTCNSLAWLSGLLEILQQANQKIARGPRMQLSRRGPFRTFDSVAGIAMHLVDWLIGLVVDFAGGRPTCSICHSQFQHDSKKLGTKRGGLICAVWHVLLCVINVTSACITVASHSGDPVPVRVK